MNRKINKFDTAHSRPTREARTPQSMVYKHFYQQFHSVQFDSFFHFTSIQFNYGVLINFNRHNYRQIIDLFRNNIFLNGKCFQTMNQQNGLFLLMFVDINGRAECMRKKNRIHWWCVQRPILETYILMRIIITWVAFFNVHFTGMKTCCWLVSLKHCSLFVTWFLEK